MLLDKILIQLSQVNISKINWSIIFEFWVKSASLIN